MTSDQVEWSKTVNTCSAVEKCWSDDYDDDDDDDEDHDSDDDDEDHEAGFSIRVAGRQNSPAISC